MGKSPGVLQALSPPSHTATVASVSLTSVPSAHHVYFSVCVFGRVIAVMDVQSDLAQDIQRQKSNKCTMLWLQMQ